MPSVSKVLLVIQGVLVVAFIVSALFAALYTPEGYVSPNNTEGKKVKGFLFTTLADNTNVPFPIDESAITLPSEPTGPSNVISLTGNQIKLEEGNVYSLTLSIGGLQFISPASIKVHMKTGTGKNLMTCIKNERTIDFTAIDSGVDDSPENHMNMDKDVAVYIYDTTGKSGDELLLSVHATGRFSDGDVLYNNLSFIKVIQL